MGKEFKIVLLAFFVAMIIFRVSIEAQTDTQSDSLLFQYESASSDSGKVHALTELSNHFMFIDIKKAIRYAEKAMDISERSSDKNLLHIALNNTGMVYFQSGAFEISAKYFFQYLDIMKAHENQQGIAAAEGNLGALYLMLNQYEQSKAYFESALNYYQSLPVDETKKTPLHELYTICNNIGVVYQKLIDYPKAIEYYNRGITLAKRHYDGYKMHAMLLNNLGSIYIEQNEPERAIEYIDEAFKIRIANNDLTGLAQSYRMLGRHYVATKEYPIALENLNQGRKMAKQIGNRTLEAEILDYLFQAWQGMKNSDSALKYFVLHSELLQEINKEAALSKLTSLEITAKYEAKEKLMQMEQKRRELYFLFVAITLVLLLAIVGLLYFLSHSRNSRLQLEKKVADLDAKNLILEKNNLTKELDLKNKELTTNVMYQIQKNELLHHIIQKLQQIAQAGKKPGEHEILEIINSLEKTQEQTLWNEFEIRFQQVHNDFYDRLNEINPELSVNERRLCAFLRLNMTTKEISSITGQSPRTIDVARTRLRKKLNLTNSETGLVEFLSGV